MTNTNFLLADSIRQALRRLRDLEAEDDPAFTAEQISFLEKRLHEMRVLLEAAQPKDDDMDIDRQITVLLARNRQIAAIWSIEDVQNVRPDLTDDQAWDVLQQAGDKHDAEWGISFTTLETVADDLFPEPDEA